MPDFVEVFTRSQERGQIAKPPEGHSKGNHSRPQTSHKPQELGEPEHDRLCLEDVAELWLAGPLVGVPINGTVLLHEGKDASIEGLIVQNTVVKRSFGNIVSHLQPTTLHSAKLFLHGKHTEMLLIEQTPGYFKQASLTCQAAILY